MNQKIIFQKLLVGSAILLAILPFIVTFSAALTSLFNHMGWYVALQNWVVPFEARLVAVLLRTVNIESTVTPNANFSLLLNRPNGTPLPIRLEWNCLGWQSLVLLGLTFSTGLHGNWKFLSKVEVIIIGILGTFLVNIFRMAFITALAFYVNHLAAMIIHDYFAAFVALVWLLLFWWFSYSFILEERKTDAQGEIAAV